MTEKKPTLPSPMSNARDISGLVMAVSELRTEVSDLTGAIQDRDSRNRWIFGGFVLLIGILAWVAVTSAITSFTAVWAVSAAPSARGASREIACQSYNDDTVDRVNGILLSFIAGAEDPVETGQLVEALLLPHRDCSEQGILDYFDGDPATDPFVPTELPPTIT